MTKVREAGLRVPVVSGIEEVSGRLGIVMERIDGKVLGNLFLGEIWRLARYARIMAEVHAEMHTHEVPELPSFHEHLERRIATQSVLPQQMKKAVLALLDRLPDGNAVCHADFYIADFSKWIWIITYPYLG